MILYAGLGIRGNGSNWVMGGGAKIEQNDLKPRNKNKYKEYQAF
jgi:hypothetical protein